MSGAAIHESAIAVLRMAGWFPGRIVNTTNYVESWGRRGVSTNLPAEDFCREFGGLEIHHPPRVSVGGREYSDFTNLDPVSAVSGISEVALREYSRLAGEALCPVGINRSHMTVLIGPSGRVVGGVDNYLFELGADLKDAINKITAGIPPRKIGEWTPMS